MKMYAKPLGFAATLFLAAGIATSAHAQAIGDLVGSWRNTNSLTQVPSCNDVWSVTENGAVIAQGRASYRILSENGVWRIADQEVNVGFFEANIQDVSPQALSVDGNNPSDFTLRWGGEMKPASLSAVSSDMAPPVTLLQIGDDIYARCPTALNLSTGVFDPADTIWTPPDKTAISYHRCAVLYDRLATMSASVGNEVEMESNSAIRNGWRDARDRLADNGDISEMEAQVQQMWQVPNSPESLQGMTIVEWFRCNGRAPIDLF